jgi:hypothetical protein
MKKFYFVLISMTFFLNVSCILAQDEEDSNIPVWEFSAELDFTFDDPFIVGPVATADYKNLHLEARYNYEGKNTGSGWIGYNFSGGREFEYLVTPIIGGLVGGLDGIGIGLEFTFNYKNFEIDHAMEFRFDFNTKENDDFYSWTDISYSPLEWFYFGVSGQRTRLIENDVDIQLGPFAGIGYNEFELAGYTYNLGTEDYYFVVSTSYSF